MKILPAKCNMLYSICHAVMQPWQCIPSCDHGKCLMTILTCWWAVGVGKDAGQLPFFTAPSAAHVSEALELIF